MFPLSDFPGTLPLTPLITTSSLYMAVGSSSVAGDPLHRLSFLNKAYADVDPSLA
jgi:hypothetical protein